MKTIKENVTNEIIIKNSKFISLLYKIDNILDVESILNSLKEEYKDATHIVYAYILPNSEKYSDDGEPLGTAGAPVMDVLKKKALTNVLAVIIRYFGGVKLGAGGLVRAYSKSTSEALKETTLEEIVFYNYYEFITDYDNLKLLNNITNDFEIINKEFKEDIVYTIKIRQEEDNILNIKNDNIKIKKL